MGTVRFNPPTAWPQSGRGFNHGVVAPGACTLPITGRVAWDANGTVVGAKDCERQVRQAFDNVASILAAVGGRLSDIVSLTIYFVSADDLPAIQTVRAERFAAEEAPASILIEVSGLVSSDLLVELVPIAVIPRERYRDSACANRANNKAA